MRRKSKDASLPKETLSVPQTGKSAHPFYNISSYAPFSKSEMELYKSLREGVPIIDAAIYKLVRLLGDFTVKASDKGAEKELSYFLRSVNVDGERQGITAFISTFFEQLLTYGTAVGEMVLTSEGFTQK